MKKESLSSIDIFQLWQNPMLRLYDIPRMGALVQSLMLNPEDEDLLDVFKQNVESQAAKAALSQDAFWPNYPPVGALPTLQRGRIGLAGLPTGDVLSLPEAGKARNILLTGIPGYGKTNLLRAINLQLLENSSIIWFDKKADSAECSAFNQSGLPIRVFDYSEIPISVLQIPFGMSRDGFCNRFTAILASHLDLWASRRLLLERLHELFRVKKEPCFYDLIEIVERKKPLSNFGREVGYREAILAALKFIKYSFGDCINYSYSEAIDEICSFKGLTIIRTHGLDDSMSIFYASLFINWAFEKRISPTEAEKPIVFCMDDALGLVRGAAYKESAEGANPISSWALVGRSRGISFIVGTHSFSEVSPVFKANCQVLIACNCRGDDAVSVARYMNLNQSQSAKLPVLQPGEVIVLCPEVWPVALYGKVPFVR